MDIIKSLTSAVIIIVGGYAATVAIYNLFVTLPELVLLKRKGE